MAKVRVSRLNERVFEVFIPGANGIAVRNDLTSWEGAKLVDDAWELSPGIRKEKATILKRIAELSPPPPQEKESE